MALSSSPERALANRGGQISPKVKKKKTENGLGTEYLRVIRHSEYKRGRKKFLSSPFSALATAAQKTKKKKIFFGNETDKKKKKKMEREKRFLSLSLLRGRNFHLTEDVIFS